jgi:hypothetical protein
MRSKPYNIILTRNPLLVDELFFRKESYGRSLDDVLESLGPAGDPLDTGTFVVAPNATHNHGFLSMESVFGGEGKSYVSIRLVESSKMLEFFSVSPHGWDELMRDRLKQKSIVQGDVETLDDVAIQRPTFYLSFGVGPNIQTWSGPYIVNIADANLSITSDGIRELEILFTPTVDSMKVFTDKVLNDIGYRSRDSIFDTVEGANKVADKSTFAQEKFKVDIVGRRERLSSMSESSFANAVSEVTQAVGAVGRAFGAIAGLFGGSSSNERTEEAPAQTSTFRRGTWNYAVRYLILKYLDKLFEKVPTGNVLVLFDDDLERDGYCEDLNRKSMSLVTRCQKPLADMGITISRSKNNAPKAAILDDVKSKVAGKKVAKGEHGRDLSKNVPANQDYNTESSKWPHGSIVLDMGQVHSVDNKEISTPTHLKPLATLQRRLSKLSQKPSDFTIYEEQDYGVNSLLKMYGLIDDPKQPVVIFGRKSVINELVYGQSREVSQSMVYNSTPFNNLSTKGPKGRVNDWAGYRRDFVDNKVNIKNKTSSFGESFNFSDIASRLGRTSLDDVDLVFAHNTTNANVLDVNFESKPYVGVLMNYANRPNYRLLDKVLDTSAIQLERLQSINFNFVEYLAEEVKKRKREGSAKDKSIVKLVKEIVSEDEVAIRKLNEDYVAQGLNAGDFLDLLLVKLASNAVGSFTTEQRSDTNSLVTDEANLLRQINKSVIKVTLRTLPFFNSDIRVGSKCVLFGEPNYIIGSRVGRGQRGLAFYSNSYNVVGFKHSMSKDDAYSEFTLVQDGFGSGENLTNLTLAEFFKKELKDIKGSIAEEEEQERLAARSNLEVIQETVSETPWYELAFPIATWLFKSEEKEEQEN